MENKEKTDYELFKELKERKEAYLKKYGYTEKNKLDRIIDLLTILVERFNENE